VKSHLRPEITEFLNDFIVGDRRLAERRDLTIVVPGIHLTIGRPLQSALRRVSDLDQTLVVVDTSTGRVVEPEDFSAQEKSAFADAFVAFGDPKVMNRENQGRLALLGQLLFLLRVMPIAWESDVAGALLGNLRRALGLSQAALADQLGTSRVSVSRWEASAQIPSRQKIYDLCRLLSLVCPPKTNLVRVVDFSPELLGFLQEDPTRLRSLTPDQFERFVAERMERMGYNVTLTGASNRKDGGIDLIAVPKLANVGSVVIAGQMKHHQGEQKTGRDAVDRLLAWKDSYFGVGLLVTNTTFTHDAVSTAQKERNARFLHLRDFTDLKRWLEGRFGEQEDWREIPDRIELAPGLVVEIPRPRLTPVFQARSLAENGEE
jgi:transcriptional regulator with XRE-family HTH domain